MINLRLSTDGVALRGRKFAADPDNPEESANSVAVRTYNSILTLANAQSSVYNAVSKLDLGTVFNQRLAFFGTAPAFSWYNAVDDIAEGRVTPVVTDDTGFTTEMVPAFESVDAKLRSLSKGIAEAKDEYERTGSSKALLEYGRLSKEFELIATAKVHKQEPRQEPSLELQQADYQARIENLLDQDNPDLGQIIQLDHYISGIQYEREFRRNVESSCANILDYTTKQTVDNLRNILSVARVQNICSYTNRQDLYNFAEGFSSLPASFRSPAFEQFAKNIDAAISERQSIQDAIARLVGRSDVAQKFVAWNVAKYATQVGVRLTHKVQQIASEYNIDGDDVVRRLSKTKLNNPLLQSLTEAVVDGMSPIDYSTDEFFHAMCYDVNLSRIGAAMLDRTRMQQCLRDAVKDIHQQVYQDWDGDAGKLRTKINSFIDRYQLQADIDRLEVGFGLDWLTPDDLMTEAGRRRIMQQIRDQFQAIRTDSRVKDIWGMIVGGTILSL